jgi:sugar lactone lactonase YvrE
MGVHVSIQRNRLALSALVLGLVATFSLPVGAAGAGGAAAARVDQGRPDVFPTTISLPDGFQPEGIAIRAMPFAYFGSLADGSIYRANLVTGEGGVISEGPGTPSVGLDIDGRGRLFVAGGAAGDARVVSASTGDVLASYQLASAPTFVNDVIVTPDAAWFTDSLNPVLYKLPLDRRGTLADPEEVVGLPLTGDLVFEEGFNTNGISRTPDGAGLLVIQSNTGLLFRVDPASGATTQVDLGGQTLPNGDGMLVSGRTLHVVQNQLNQVAVVRLDRSGSSGTVVAPVADARFDVPTTVARVGNRLYLPNARFTTPPGPTTPYSAVAIRRP